ncbi:hypothetical protein QU894_28305, partial [Citrobacter freundii]
MNKRLHLITTCTRRKAGSVEDTVFPGDTSLDDAFDGWYRGLTLSGTKTHVKQRFLPLTPLLMVS